MSDEKSIAGNPQEGIHLVSRRRVLATGGLAALGLISAACGAQASPAPAAPASAAGSSSGGQQPAPAGQQPSSGGQAPAFDSSNKGFTLNTHIPDDSLVKVQKKGELVIATSGDWPYSYMDSKTNQWTGIDADIIQFIAKMLKVPKVNVQTVPFDGMIPGVLDGRFDMVGDSIHSTPKRAEVVQFSFPNYYYSEWLVLPKGKFPNAHQLTDMKGHSMGALLGTNYADWVQATSGVEFKGYKTWQDIVNDLQSGRLDSAVHDQPIIAASIAEHPDWKIELASGYTPQQLKNPAGYSRYAFRQADVQLCDAFSRAMEWMETNGDMEKILKKWGLGGYNN